MVLGLGQDLGWSMSGSKARGVLYIVFALICVHLGLIEFAWVCRAIRGLFGIMRDISEFVWVCLDVLNLLGFTWVYLE